MTNETRAIGIEIARVSITALLVAAPFVVGVMLGDRAPDAPLEPRYALVIGAAALGVLAVIAHDRERRRACAAACVVPIAHLVLSGSVVISALDVTLVLLGALGIAIQASRRIARSSAPRWQRFAALALFVAFVPGPLFTLGWGLVSTTLAPALTRAFHSFPERAGSEREVSFASRDGTRIDGTYTPGRDGAPGIVLVHGLGDSRRRLVPWSRELASHGVHVLRIDLRAHGTSGGVAVTFADREPDDVVASLRFLRAQPGVGPLHLFGVSMGGGASLAAFSRADDDVDVESMIALAPASDYRPIVEPRLPPFEPLHSLARGTIRGVTHGLGNRSPLELAPADAVVAAGPAPILVVHSRSDRTVPASVTERLVRRAPWVEVEWIDGVDHVSMPEHALTTLPLRTRIERFLGVPE